MRSLSKRWENILLSKPTRIIEKEGRKDDDDDDDLLVLLYVSSSDHTVAHFLEYLTSIEYVIHFNVN